MKFFYLGLSNLASEVNEVHLEDCPQIPPMLNRSYLGPFNNAKEALRKAKEIIKNVSACPQCCQKEMSSVAFFTPVGIEEE